MVFYFLRPDELCEKVENLMIHYYFQFSYRGRCTGQKIKNKNTMWNSITFSVVFRVDFCKDESLTVYRRNGFALRIAKEGHSLAL